MIPRGWIILVAGVVAIIGGFLAGCDFGEERKRIDLKDRISNAELDKLEPKRDPDVLYFGFDLRASPKEDVRQYLPFLKYLAKATGYRFELRFMPDKENTLAALCGDEIQFAALGAGSYVVARETCGVIAVVRGLNPLGRATYQSVIFVSPESTILKIEDLAGKRFAFGSETSTQGHLIPRIILKQHGISLEDLAEYEHTGSHRNCANEVLAGRFHAGGMQDTMGSELAKAGLIRIIHTSKQYPSSGIVANKDVPPEILAKVKQALLDFHPKGRDSAGLYHWDKTEMTNGFTEARDEDYAELREWSRKFGLLKEAGAGEGETR